MKKDISKISMAVIVNHTDRTTTVKMSGEKRLNPIYWIFQYLGGLVAIFGLFFIPYLIEKILGG